MRRHGPGKSCNYYGGGGGEMGAPLLLLLQKFSLCRYCSSGERSKGALATT